MAHKLPLHFLLFHTSLRYGLWCKVSRLLQYKFIMWVKHNHLKIVVCLSMGETREDKCKNEKKKQENEMILTINTGHNQVTLEPFFPPLVIAFSIYSPWSRVKLSTLNIYSNENFILRLNFISVIMFRVIIFILVCMYICMTQWFLNTNEKMFVQNVGFLGIVSVSLI